MRNAWHSCCAVYDTDLISLCRIHEMIHSKFWKVGQLNFCHVASHGPLHKIQKPKIAYDSFCYVTIATAFVGTLSIM